MSTTEGFTKLFPHLSLILGGASSGKSAFAEKIIVNSGLTPLYLATSDAHDDEMRTKIARHRTQRGADWALIETPLDAADALSGVKAGHAVLLDCATMWLANQMGAGRDLDAAQAALLRALHDCAAPVVVVSNEVGMGIVPENALARQFRDAQGKLNQAIAAQADCAALIVAGLPLVLKGQLPSGAA